MEIKGMNNMKVKKKLLKPNPQMYASKKMGTQL